MQAEKYNFRTNSNFERFEFESVGPKGTIKKVVEFSKYDEPDVYNLCFGDYDSKTKNIDDKIVTNNADTQKVLATVADIINIFSKVHPERWIFATGSNSVRTRLYRIGITTHYFEIKNDFLILGMNKNNSFESFQLNKKYYGFLVKRI